MNIVFVCQMCSVRVKVDAPWSVRTEVTGEVSTGSPPDFLLAFTLLSIPDVPQSFTQGQKARLHPLPRDIAA
jgi:hypothetical protein